MKESQLLKGILEGCILSIIARGETYGYEILSILDNHGFHDIMDGTLYPILTRMEKKNLISCRIGKSPHGPKRKYFSITEEGKEYYLAFKEAYKNITKNADSILLNEPFKFNIDD